MLLTTSRTRSPKIADPPQRSATWVLPPAWQQLRPARNDSSGWALARPALKWIGAVIGTFGSNDIRVHQCVEQSVPFVRIGIVVAVVMFGVTVAIVALAPHSFLERLLALLLGIGLGFAMLRAAAIPRSIADRAAKAGPVSLRPTELPAPKPSRARVF
jgi:hypothetical protein